MHDIIPRVLGTPSALALIETIRNRHGSILFFQSGGCCDGSAPLCFPAEEFSIGDADVFLGVLGGVPFYIGGDQFEYWKHTQLIIDVVDGNGGMFSLENGSGKRFITRSRLFSDEEYAMLSKL